MNIEYRLIQIVPDLLRNEGRNVAIVAHDGKTGYFRAIGTAVNSKEVDLDLYCAIPGVPKHADWVYEEWIDWFNELVLYEGRDQGRLFQALDVLEGQGKNFVVRGSGQVTETTGRSATECVEEIFQAMVQEPSKPKQQDFQERVRMIVNESGIGHQKGFHADVQVEVTREGKKRPVMLDFPYLLDGTKRFGFKTIKMRNTADFNLAAQVNDAYLTFEKALDLGFLQEGQCIALSERPTTDRQKFANKLMSIAHFVDVRDSNALRNVHQLVFAQ